MSTSADILVRGGKSKAVPAQTKGIFACFIITAGIAASYWALHSLEWKGSTQAHTELELLATLMALVVGLMAIVRYYSQRNALLLLLGAAFIGAAVLDG